MYKKIKNLLNNINDRKENKNDCLSCYLLNLKKSITPY